MKSALIRNGLSAGQRAISKPLGACSFPGWPGKNLFPPLIIILLGLLFTCNGKSNGQVNSQERDSAQAKLDTLDNPSVNIQVSKRYDDKGNLIGFDSTYNSFYSNIEGSVAGMDSLMDSLDRYFMMHRDSLWENGFNKLFFNDSLRYPDSSAVIIL